MIHRVATSELYRSSPTAVRCHWAFRDFVEAHVMLDYADSQRPQPPGAAGGAVGR